MFGRVVDTDGQGVPHAWIDAWQTDAAGLYDLQARDPSVMDMRGRVQCDETGRFHFRTVKPLGYSIPMDGPVGAMVKRQDRHGMRPAHIHLLVQAPGFRELVTALYLADDVNIDSDTVFGVSTSLVVEVRDDLPDNLVGGVADLSELIIETLALAIDPYPREPNAELPEEAFDPDGAEELPFAQLKPLRDKL